MFESELSCTALPLGTGSMSSIFIKMELCHFTLKYFIHHHKSGLASGYFVAIGKDVGEGLKYIHDKGYIHRDIKPDNIFCKKDTTGRNVWKIGDLGLAVEASTDPKGIFGQVGTRLYLSPEMRLDSGYSTKTDLYSLGLLFLQLVEGMETRFNLARTTEILDDITNSKKRVAEFKYIIARKYSNWLNIIKGLLDLQTNRRFGAGELLKALRDIKI